MFGLLRHLCLGSPGARKKNTGLEHHLLAGNGVVLMDVLHMVFGFIDMKTLGEMIVKISRKLKILNVLKYGKFPLTGFVRFIHLDI